MVSLAPSLSEIVVELGAADLLVGVVGYSRLAAFGQRGRTSATPRLPRLSYESTAVAYGFYPLHGPRADRSSHVTKRQLAQRLTSVDNAMHI